MFKKAITLLVFTSLVLGLFISVYAEESITIGAYYASPFGVYDRLRLFPHSDINPANPCADNGEMYYYSIDNQVYLCNDGVWERGGNFWDLDQVNNWLYGRDINATVGIGTQDLSTGGTLVVQRNYAVASPAPTLRLQGRGTNFSQSRLNFGDGDFVYLEEPLEAGLSNRLEITANATAFFTFTGVNSGIGDLTPDALMEITDGSLVNDLLMVSSDDDRNGDSFIVKSDGKVGIDTATPLSWLHIQQSTVPANPSAGALRITSLVDSDVTAGAQVRANGGDPFLSLDIEGVSGWSMGIDNSDSDKFKIVKNWNFDATAADTVLTISDTGKVGIGNNNPLTSLDVNGDLKINNGLYINDVGGNPIFRVSNASGDWKVEAEQANIDFSLLGRANIYGIGVCPDIAEDIRADGCKDAESVIIDQNKNRKVTKSRIPYDTKAGGIISRAPIFHIGKVNHPDYKPLALAGQVYCKVTTENGAIQAGDLLVTSSKAGYAMRADLDKLKPGMLIGKALEPLETGDGEILVLISR